jgi:class 3 adenylate cyclase/alpha-beta hydrolase superfamily lysophospholipase
MVEISDVKYARSADGIDIAYQSIGQGPLDLVFVSGFISHLDFNWEFPWFNSFERYASMGRVTFFDKRGTGLSDRSLGYGSVADRSDDIRAVMDAAGIERAPLWGVSEGGPLSILFAASCPERVSHLIIFGSGARFRSGPDYPITLDWGEEDGVVEEMVSEWGTGRVYGKFIQHPPDPQEAERKLARFERNACTPQMVGDIMRSNLQLDVRDLLPTINVPTLVLHNVGDPLIPVEAGRYLAEHIPGARYVEGPGDWHGSWRADDLRWLTPHVLEFLGGTAGASVDAERVLATVLFTDIVRSTEQTAALGDRSWRDLMDRHDRIIKNDVERYRGRLVNTTGDGVIATFDGPARGIQCANAIRADVRGIGLEVRGGLHTGEVETRGSDITGIGVVIARRICDLAQGGELLASRTVKDLVTGSGITFNDRGEHSLKGVPDSWRLFEVPS